MKNLQLISFYAADSASSCSSNTDGTQGNSCSDPKPEKDKLKEQVENLKAKGEEIENCKCSNVADPKPGENCCENTEKSEGSLSPEDVLPLDPSETLNPDLPDDAVEKREELEIPTAQENILKDAL